MSDPAAIQSMLHDASRIAGQLTEHEVYRLIELASGIAPPRHVFVPVGEPVPTEEVAGLGAGGVVLKVVSPDVVHKSDAGGVRFCDGEPGEIEREVRDLERAHTERGAAVRGTLIVERVRGTMGLGAELFVGVRDTREFGPVIAAGLGGTATEYLAGAMREGRAVARAVIGDSTPERFLEWFRATTAYHRLAGRLRGSARLVGDHELLRCFAGFFTLADHFGGTGHGERLAELEVNPFTVREGRLVPLDGRARLCSEPSGQIRPPRPAAQINRLLEPASIAVVGVSAKSENFGRIILRNILACGFPVEASRIIKPGVEQIDSVRCVDSISELDIPADLLVVAAGADQLPDLVRESADSGLVRSLVVIPGGVGETEDSADLLRSVQQSLADSRTKADGGPVLIGPNCLGMQSRPGRYDTFFIPESKLAKRHEGPGRPVALVSQSGAFVVSRLSCLEVLDPRLTVTIGNQADLTIGDMVEAIASRDDISVLGVYAEGFADGDGLATLGAIRRATRAGKAVVLYKAGRTEQGRSAAAGHTASIAGDYAICRDGAAAAGALVAESFTEFEALLELSTMLLEKAVRGLGLGAISNAGFETVGMADSLGQHEHSLTLPTLSETTRSAIAAALKANRLSSLVNVRNPLDLTPMAGEAAYEACARAMLTDPAIDAMVLSAVPLTPALATTEDEINAGWSLADLAPELAALTDKPIVVVVDAGSRYDPLVRRVRESGLPVLRRADEAVRLLGRYLRHRLANACPQG